MVVYIIAANTLLLLVLSIVLRKTNSPKAKIAAIICNILVIIGSLASIVLLVIKFIAS